MNPAARVYSVSAGEPFLPALARWVRARYGGTPETPARLRILLPSRRACRALHETFLDAGGGAPMLLPRIRPLGDLDEESLPPDLAAEMAALDVPPPMEAERRLLLLTRLVLRFEGRRIPAAQAVPLARQLARLLDDAAREEIDLARLGELVEGDLARHWQRTVEFLKIISREWPRVLAEEGVADPADHRNRVLRAAAKAWRKNPPDYPVIAAGSTGTHKATAELLSVIARLPEGAVILPGLDAAMPDAEWETVEPTHPQYAMKKLLEAIGCVRGDVKPLAEKEQETPRLRLLRSALQPPEATGAWTKTTADVAEGLRGMRLLAAETPLDEARMVAVALRQAVETPGKTAALVTPDRELARMVAAQMKRFGIAIDDSGGRPLLSTPPGGLLRLTAQLAGSACAPADLLAALRHPLAGAGRDTVECRKLSHSLERKFLRGVRPAAGLSALREAARADGKGGAALHALLAELEQKMRLFAAAMASRDPVSPSALLKEHVAFTQWLCATDTESGEERLWAGDAGNQLAQALARLGAHADLLPPIDPPSYAGFFDALLATETYRPRHGLHPRLHILSPIEARLQQFDLVVLSGLNEGSWPAHAASDPWMSRPMRGHLGLPPLERETGQAAHDFLSLCASPEALLTRARKSEGAPTVASRWLVRLETLCEGRDREAWRAACDGAEYERALATLDAPAGGLPPLTRPRPSPPVEARPKRVSATTFENWQRDPYVVYARYVLGLRALDPLDKEPDARDFGNIIHNALERFTAAWPENLPDDPCAALIECGRQAFGDHLDRPSVKALWWPRFREMAAWLAEEETARRRTRSKILSERKVEWEHDIAGGKYTLHARIDRMELDAAGNATLVDYKTGTPPTNTEIKNGLASQLPFEALLLMNGAPEDRPAAVTELEYWKLAGDAERCEVKPLSKVGDIAALMEQCRQRIEALLTEYNDPATPFAAQDNPSLLKYESDYEHLIRRKEWAEG